MLNNHVGSMVQFTESDVRVFAMSSLETENQKTYAYCLLISEYITRMYATVKSDKAARAVLIDTINYPDALDTNLNGLLAGYGRMRGLTDVKLVYGLSGEREKRGCDFMIAHNFKGNYSPKFKPHGFGLLGRNIESGSVTACLATLRFAIDDMQHNDDAVDALYMALGILRQELAQTTRVGISKEVAIVRKVLAEVSSEFDLVTAG